MGIVVSIIMLVGLLAQMRCSERVLQNPVVLTSGYWLLFLGGCWNAGWYGLQNLSHFWGQIAIVSGLLMILTGIRLRVNRDQQQLVLTRSSSIYAWALWAALLGCFLVYAIALIRLNLGLAIIR